MPRETRTFPLPTSLPGPWPIFSFNPLGSPAICSSEDQMNKLSVFALSVFLVLFICHCYPSAGTASRPEAAKLAYFARKWVSEAEVKPSAFGPGGKFTSTESCEWLPGKFAILCTSEGNMDGWGVPRSQRNELRHGRKVLHLLRDQQLGRKRLFPRLHRRRHLHQPLRDERQNRAGPFYSQARLRGFRDVQFRDGYGL